jgi:hypothetical protein
VDNAIRSQCDQLIGVVGRHHANRADAGELAGVVPYFVGGVYPHAVNSVPGFSATARTAMDPMPPVDQTTTRNGLSAIRGRRLQLGGKGFQAVGVRPHSPCHRFAVELVRQ